MRATRFAGPWSVQRINITRGDRGGDVLHKSNPSVALLHQPIGRDRYIMSYRVNFDGSINAVALAEDFSGPFHAIVNITAQPGEDPVRLLPFPPQALLPLTRHRPPPPLPTCTAVRVSGTWPGPDARSRVAAQRPSRLPRVRPP